MTLRERNTHVAARRDEFERRFLVRSAREIDSMRRGVPQLTLGESGVWQEVRFYSQRMAENAKQLEFGVLGACAHELARLAEQKFAGAAFDERFLLTTTSAIETVALEIGRLTEVPAAQTC